MFPQGLINRLELAREVRITNFIGVKVGHAHPHTVFHLGSADVVQERSPSFVFFQVFRDVLGKEDVPCIATIHHSLGNVDASPGDVKCGARVRVKFEKASDEITLPQFTLA